jgi:glycosyltransferase involved in cell wall biosynthesis
MPRLENSVSTTSESGRPENLVPARQESSASAQPRLDDSRRKAVTSLSVLVPTYNERYLVETSLRRLQVLAESPLLERVKIIVVDDGSSDGTTEVLGRFRASLESEETDPKLSWVWDRHAKNSGKGAAIRTALEHADTDLVVIHDADLEYHPGDLLPMVELFLAEEADAVFGSRFMSGGYKRALFFRHALGNKLLTFLCDLVCDLNLTDMETCYKMVRTDLLKSIPLESATFDVEPELAIKLAKRGSRIFEVPISYSGRTYTEGKKIGWKDGVRALWAILHYAFSDRIYKTDEHGGEILERMNKAPRFNRWMADVVAPHLGDRVLEIGAGRGNMSLHFMPRSIYWATDVNTHYLEYLLTLRSTRPYMRVAFTDAEKFETFPQGQGFDSVVCLNVVEHLPNDVGALRNIWNALEPDGCAIVLVPFGPKLFGTLDEVLGHCRRYTIEQLSTVALQAGFRIDGIIKFNRPGTPAWWLNGKILKRRTFGLAQIRMLNILTPLFRKVDRLLPFPPLSLIAVLRKDGESRSFEPETN